MSLMWCVCCGTIGVEGCCGNIGVDVDGVLWLLVLIHYDGVVVAIGVDVCVCLC